MAAKPKAFADQRQTANKENFALLNSLAKLEEASDRLVNAIETSQPVDTQVAEFKQALNKVRMVDADPNPEPPKPTEGNAEDATPG